jgi:Fic family protein
MNATTPTLTGHFEAVTFEEHLPGRGGPEPVETRADAFVPDPLPPDLDLPNLHFELYEHLVAAERALSQLEGTACRLTNPHLLIRPFIRREAILSSKIENTVATAQELALFEADVSAADQRNEIREVWNYVRAIEHGLASELPLSLRLLKDLHRILLDGVRGEDKRPGEFRIKQNYIGDPHLGIAHARFVPPPPRHLDVLLDNLERSLHEESRIPRLIRMALAHYQFEAIHPFNDGNGRVGRLLITLQLCSHAQLSKPFVYVSAFFEKHRPTYYDLLRGVSMEGRWLDWFGFFLGAIATQAEDAQQRTDRLLQLQQEYYALVRTPRASALLPKLVDTLFERPALTIREVGEITGVTPPAARRLIRKLEDAGVLREATGRTYRQIWLAQGIVSVIQEPGEEK